MEVDRLLSKDAAPTADDLMIDMIEHDLRGVININRTNLKTIINLTLKYQKQVEYADKMIESSEDKSLMDLPLDHWLRRYRAPSIMHRIDIISSSIVNYVRAGTPGLKRGYNTIADLDYAFANWAINNNVFSGNRSQTTGRALGRLQVPAYKDRITTYYMLLPIQ